LALEDLDLDPAEAHVVAGLAWIENLVAGLDAFCLASHCGHDPRSAGCRRRRRSRQDQAEARLRLVRDRLDHDELVERLERQVDGGLFDHALTIRGSLARIAATALDLRLRNAKRRTSRETNRACRGNACRVCDDSRRGVGPDSCTTDEAG